MYGVDLVGIAGYRGGRDTIMKDMLANCSQFDLCSEFGMPGLDVKTSSERGGKFREPTIWAQWPTPTN